jgi:hypothetical protein
MMTYVVLRGWTPPLQKVALDKLLHAKGGLSLREAFDSVNSLLAGETVTVPMPSLEEARILAGAAASLGALAEVVEQPARDSAIRTRDPAR